MEEYGNTSESHSGNMNDLGREVVQMIDLWTHLYVSIWIIEILNILSVHFKYQIYQLL